MGVKKIARPMNKAKNLFVKWLKENNAEGIDEYEGEDDNMAWDYYRMVSAFIGERLYIVYFMVWKGDDRISYRDEENSYDDLSIDEFLQMIS